MNYQKRYWELSQKFRQGEACHIAETNMDIRLFEFESNRVGREPFGDDAAITTSDCSIRENYSFTYPVFMRSEKKQQEQAILLLHGLNERNWNKYLTWAEYLCHHTGKAVILFPIAFHINRAPLSWSNPRSLAHQLNFRREQYRNDRSISFANVALSNRISEIPERFYLSGRQTWGDLSMLFEQIKTGRHSLFKEATQIDIFAYSIGAFLSQITLMVNDKDLFSDSRLFMFCGGSIFRSMFGISRSIMDSAAFEKLQDYYLHIFGEEPHGKWEQDSAFHAFFSMISKDRMQSERESRFTHLKERIRGVALARDKVIPYHGIEEAFGKKNMERNIRLIDFPFPYTHENPFPLNTQEETAVNEAFDTVFSQAAGFLA